ncbi:MAG TPA: hypothetical protein VE714_00260 [Gemmatimonadales bacterium]|nr:hypothetical protein [Gemmatimonadales bacterium]
MHVHGRAAFRRSPPRYIARLLAFVGLLIGTRVADGQRPASRYWFAGGVGYGYAGPAQSNGNDQYKGISGELAWGLVLTSRGLVGLNVAGWHHDTPIGSSRSDFAVVTLLAHPFGSILDNLYFQGGIGVGVASMPTLVTTSGPSRLNVTKAALQVGLGFDIPVACPFWITPFFQSFGTVGGRRLAQPAPGQTSFANAILFHFGAALKYYHPGPAGQCTRRSSAIPGR